MRQLKEKHPEAQDASLGSLLFGPIEEVPVHQTLDVSEVKTLQISARKEKDECMDERLKRVKTSLPTGTK